jgi:CheY-like chemotaxis protein
MVLAVVEDPAFRGLIDTAAREEGMSVTVLRDEPALQAFLQKEKPQVLLFDVGITTFDGPTFIESLERDPSTRSIPLVVFGSSIRADLLQDAKELGADLVLPKSAFREQLTGILRRYRGS